MKNVEMKEPNININKKNKYYFTDTINNIQEIPYFIMIIVPIFTVPNFLYETLFNMSKNYF